MNKSIAKVLGSLDKGLLVLLILPWLLLINNDIWLFDFNVLIDPWLYLGLSLRFEQFLQAYGDTYYVGRLAWTLPSHLIFKFFSPLAAQYILHVGFYYLAILSIYFLLKRIVGYRSALLASVMMGCHAWFLMAIGSNYVNGAGIAYYSAALLMLTLATQLSRWKIYLLLSGVFYGLAIFSNLTWIFLAPSLVCYYIAINRKHQAHSIAKSSIFFVAGLIFIALIFCAINFLVNGQFFFFLPSLKHILYASSYQQNPWKLSWNIWLPSAFWLALLAITFISSTVLTLVSYLKRLPNLQTISVDLQICFLLACSPFVIWEMKSEPLLQVYFYASYLMPFTFIAIGAQLHQLESVLNQLKGYQFAYITTGIIVLTLIAYRLPLNSLIFQDYAGVLTLIFCSVWLIWAGAALLFHHAIAKLLSSALLILLLAFNTVNVVSVAFSIGSLKTLAIALGYTASNQIIPSSILSEINYSQRKDAFLLVVQAQRYLQTVDSRFQLMFWYDMEESLVYRSIASAALWNHLSESFPRVGAEKSLTSEKKIEVENTLKRVPNLVILSRKTEALESAKQSLNEIGFDADLVFVHNLSQGELVLSMTFIKVYKKST